MGLIVHGLKDEAIQENVIKARHAMIKMRLIIRSNNIGIVKKPDKNSNNTHPNIRARNNSIGSKGCNKDRNRVKHFMTYGIRD